MVPHPHGMQIDPLQKDHVVDTRLRRHASSVGQGAAAQVQSQHPARQARRSNGDRFLAGAAAGCQNLDGLEQELRRCEVGKATGQIIRITQGLAPG